MSQVAPGLQGDVADPTGAPRLPRLPSLGPRVFDLAALQLAEPAQGAIYSWWPGNGFKWEADGIYMVYWALWMKSITMHGYCVLFPIHPKQYEKVVLQCDVPLHVMICLPNMRLLEGC